MAKLAGLVETAKAKINCVFMHMRSKILARMVFAHNYILTWTKILLFGKLFTLNLQTVCTATQASLQNGSATAA